MEAFSRDSAWWTFNFVANYANLRYSAMILDIRKVQQEIEDLEFSLQPVIEETARQLLAKDPGQGDGKEFIRERRRSRLFFDLTAAVYPLIEQHLFPRYETALARLDLPRELPVLDVATGSGILAAAFARRGHVVQGLDFSERLLRRAKKRFPQVDFRSFDLVNLPEVPARSFAIVSCGYFLHGLSPEFRQRMLENISRIASSRVVVFDYDRDGGWLVRLIERIEGPHYPQFIAGARTAEFARAGLTVETSFPTSEFGRVWLCRPKPIGSQKG